MAQQSLRQRHDDVDVADREKSRFAMDHTLVPVLIDLIGQDDEVALLEAQLARVLRLEVIQRPAARLVQGSLGICRGTVTAHWRKFPESVVTP